jgi:hypothetical protein
MPADQVSTHAAPARRRTTVTRQQLIEQGRSGRPWAFLPAVLQALRVAPDDEALRFLAAANFARLGLATPARDLLAELGPQTAGAPDVVALSAAIDKLPRDTLTPDRLIATCRGNIEALAGRGIDLSAELEAWSRQLESWTWFRAHDGNVVRRLGDGREPSDWVGLSDQVAEAERFAREHLVSDTEILFRPPCVLEGVAPPWMLRRLVEITAETSLGYRPRIRVLQADSLELLDGLAQADLRSTIEDPRVSFFTGPDAPEQFRADLHACFHAQIVGPYIRLPTIRTPVQPAASEIIGNAQTAQQSVAQRLDATVRKIYAGRDRAWWAARYAAARDGSDGPIRVLIPTTRHSTYVRHASHDLAKAFSEIGCRAEVFIEADDYTKSTSIAYQRHLEQLRPDLVVLINYGRANTGEMLPAPLPVVCWIQDAMWQQFDAEVGARQTEMDFLAGHLFHELSDRFGYPRRNRLSMPVVVSPRKFHRGPVDPALLERHACEIAYVSHQSETPEAQRDRLLAELAPTPVHQECVEAMYPKLREIAAGPMQRATGKWLAEVVNDTLREVTGDADPRSPHASRVTAVGGRRRPTPRLAVPDLRPGMARPPGPGRARLRRARSRRRPPRFLPGRRRPPARDHQHQPPPARARVRAQRGAPRVPAQGRGHMASARLHAQAPGPRARARRLSRAQPQARLPRRRSPGGHGLGRAVPALRAGHRPVPLHDRRPDRGPAGR